MWRLIAIIILAIVCISLIMHASELRAHRKRACACACAIAKLPCDLVPYVESAVIPSDAGASADAIACAHNTLRDDAIACENQWRGMRGHTARVHSMQLGYASLQDSYAVELAQNEVRDWWEDYDPSIKRTTQ